MKIANLSTEELVSRLMLTVINYKENEDNIHAYPVVKKGDFALLMQLCVGEKNDAGQYTACLTVTNEMLERWGFAKEKMFEIAADNSKSLFPVECLSLDKYLDPVSLGRQIQLPDDVGMSDVIVLSNIYHFNGAAAMFYDPEVLKEIANKYDVDKVALLPSGINQIYCIPLKKGMDMKECSELYEELIAMASEGRLADSILAYDKNSNMITEANGQTFTLNLNENTVRKAEHRM